VLEVPVAKDGRYEVFVGLTRARDYAIVQMSFDAHKQGDPLDLYDPEVTIAPPISLGVHELNAGTHTLSFTITGANNRALKAYILGVDYLSLLARPVAKP